MEIQNKLIAGVDDATKCPVIGSIFVAGVIADEATIIEWQRLGVKDSKLIARKKREKLAKIIKETAHGFTIKEITPQMIDDNTTFNLNDWEMLVFCCIAKDIQKFGMPEKLYVDNWETSEKGFRKRFKDLLRYSMRSLLVQKKLRFNRTKLKSLTIIPEHRADENYTVVGAASILAKTSSDAQYRKYKRKYGDFGSGNPGDPKTRLFVWQHREHPLPIIRTTWNTYKVLSKLASIEDDPLRKMKNKTESYQLID